MFSNLKPASYFAGLNERLLRLVPAAARRILEVGCGDGRLGGELKKLDPARTVFEVRKGTFIFTWM